MPCFDVALPCHIFKILRQYSEMHPSGDVMMCLYGEMKGANKEMPCVDGEMDGAGDVMS